MNKDHLINILSKNYSFDNSQDLTLLRKGTDNDVYVFFSKNGKKIIARVGKRKIASSIKFEIGLIEALIRNRVAVAPVVKTLSKKEFVELSDGTAIACFEFVNGKPVELNNNIPDVSLIKQAAKALGKFHQATINLNLNPTGRRTIYSEFERALELKQKIVVMFTDGKEFIGNVKETLERAKDIKTVWGIIHNDYNPSNILFQNSKLMSIVDFDWACPGPFLIDVGHGAVTWSTKEEEIEPDEKDFDEFIRSYRQISPLGKFNDQELYFWAAYSCLYLAANFICDSTINNKYGITRTDQSWMYKRFKYYRNRLAK